MPQHPRRSGSHLDNAEDNNNARADDNDSDADSTDDDNDADPMTRNESLAYAWYRLISMPSAQEDARKPNQLVCPTCMAVHFPVKGTPRIAIKENDGDAGEDAGNDAEGSGISNERLPWALSSDEEDDSDLSSDSGLFRSDDESSSNFESSSEDESSSNATGSLLYSDVPVFFVGPDGVIRTNLSRHDSSSDHVSSSNNAFPFCPVVDDVFIVRPDGVIQARHDIGAEMQEVLSEDYFDELSGPRSSSSNDHGTDLGAFSETHGSDDRGRRSVFVDCGIIDIRAHGVAIDSDDERRERNSSAQNEQVPHLVGLTSSTSIVRETDLVVYTAESDTPVQATEISVGSNEELRGESTSAGDEGPIVTLSYRPFDSVADSASMALITVGVAQVSRSCDNIYEEIRDEVLRDSDSDSLDANMSHDDQESAHSRELKQTSESEHSPTSTTKTNVISFEGEEGESQNNMAIIPITEVSAIGQVRNNNTDNELQCDEVSLHPSEIPISSRSNAGNESNEIPSTSMPSLFQNDNTSNSSNESTPSLFNPRSHSSISSGELFGSYQREMWHDSDNGSHHSGPFSDRIVVTELDMNVSDHQPFVMQSSPSEQAPANDDSISGNPLTHLRDYGALRVYASATCPICLDNHDVLIALRCGHCVCEEDFRQLGGYLASDKDRDWSRR
ncbi:hypothetical protein ACHAW6_001970 [Cyclotella cf. meneghiniana]